MNSHLTCILNFDTIFKTFFNTKNPQYFIFLQKVDVANYCLAYVCQDDFNGMEFSWKWKLIAKTCLCMNDSETFEILDKQYDSTLPRCCGNGPKYSSKMFIK